MSPFRSVAREVNFDRRIAVPINAQRIQAVFLAATELEGAAERARFLDGACDGDAELRSRVEALLRAHDAA